MTTTSADPAEDLFADALEVPPPQRAAFLDARCPRGTPLRADVDRLLGLHARMGDYLEAPSAARDSAARARALTPGTPFGRYRIVRVLGEGGGGIVYEAEQANPRRSVALKVMRSRLTSDEARRRFTAEAQILARLEHPDVAHVYEAGVQAIDGRELPFIALEFVADARPLTAWVQDRRLGTTARVRLMARVCRAVHHGHQKGIVHRDVKPGNVLVDRSGQPRLIDFGIAHVDDGSRAGIAGTAEYMSPEQCGDDPGGADVRSDVYSLGVVLHELLTGSRPHHVDGLPFAEAARRIREEPVRVDGLPLHRDLRAILARALARRPEERYASASALADDLDHHLAHRPVSAVPAGLLYTASKFARRHRIAVAALAGLLVVSVAAAIVSTWQTVEKERERRTAELQSYVANLSAASAALRENDVAEARLRLDAAPAPRRGWEWEHLRGRLDSSEAVLHWSDVRIRCGAFSRDGSLVAAAGANANRSHCSVRIWDAATHEVVSTADSESWPWTVAFSSDARLLAVGYVGAPPRVLDVATGRVLTTMEATVGNVNRIAFLGGDERVLTASADGTLRIWNASGGELEHTVAAHDDRVIAFEIAPDASFLVTGARNGEIGLFDLPELTRRHVWRAHDKSVEGVSLFPGADRVASCSRDGTIRIWDLAAQRAEATFSGHEANVRDVAVAPDGATVVSASHDRTVRVWSVAERRQIACLTGHADFVNAVVHVPGEDRFASFSYDGSVRLWKRHRQDPEPTLRGHVQPVIELAFCADGRLLASGDERGEVRVWDAASGAVVRAPENLGRALEGLAFTPGAEHVVAVSRGSEIRVTPVHGNGPARSFLAQGRSHVSPRALQTRDWTHLTTTGDGWILRSRIGASVERIERWKGHAAPVAYAAVSPRRHEVVATVDVTGELRVWGADRTRPRVRASLAPDSAGALAFTPDGASVLAGSTGGEVLIVDAARARAPVVLRGHSAVVNAVAMSPDGRRIATGSNDATIRIWDAHEHVQVLVLRGQGEPIYALAWSPDGRTLASGSGVTECHVKLWSVADAER